MTITKKSGHFAFKDLELWIGTENNKGLCGI
jgi:hypothetical protein